MIPSDERQFFRTFVEEAVTLAHTGRELEGFRLLDMGLALAEAAVAGGERWGEELAHRYRVALVRFAETFPVVFDSLPGCPGGLVEEREQRPTW